MEHNDKKPDALDIADGLGGGDERSLSGGEEKAKEQKEASATQGGHYLIINQARDLNLINEWQRSLGR